MSEELELLISYISSGLMDEANGVIELIKRDNIFSNNNYTINTKPPSAFAGSPAQWSEISFHYMLRDLSIKYEIDESDIIAIMDTGTHLRLRQMCSVVDVSKFNIYIDNEAEEIKSPTPWDFKGYMYLFQNLNPIVKIKVNN